MSTIKEVAPEAWARRREARAEATPREASINARRTYALHAATSKRAAKRRSK